MHKTIIPLIAAAALGGVTIVEARSYHFGKRKECYNVRKAKHRQN